MRATFANIYLNNLKNNFYEIKKFLQPNTKICVPVKADAYGHGATAISQAVIEYGADYLAVAAVAEGIELRKTGITIPILVLSLPQPSEFSEIIQYGLTPTVFDLELISLLEDTAEKYNECVNVHLKIDTGMGRIGCSPDDASKIALAISKSKWINLDGVFTHFSVADSLNQEDIIYTKKQIELFNNAIKSIKKEGINPGLCHAASSAAIFRYPEAHFDMVRPGIILYGYYPGDITEEYLKDIKTPVHLIPVMELCSSIVAIKDITPGDCISYGRTWVAKETGKIGVIPVGYADGLLRSFAKELKVSVKNKAYKISGRICMDQCMINLEKGLEISRWDKVIIFGPKEYGALNDAADIAKNINTIAYEITCGIDKRVPRLYKK